MIAIPPGTLRMGSNDTRPNETIPKSRNQGSPQVIDLPPEFPEHEVSVLGFYLDRTEVTNRAFMEFLEATGRESWGANIWPENGGRPDPGKLDWPVTRVTYHEAVEFAAWRGCCLPDESQLEWAARGPKARTAPANLPDNAPLERWTQLHAVESDPIDRTEIGAQILHGLFGNAGELTLFRFRPYPHPRRPVSGSSARIAIVVRSGTGHDSLGSKLVSLGFVKRGAVLPEAHESHIGFRCARSIQTRISLSPQHLQQE